MTIERSVPNVRSTRLDESRDFYVDFLGFRVAMDRDEIITFAAPGRPKAQLSVLRPDESGVPHPDVSIEVEDVDEVHATAAAKGIDIVYPITDEPWGVRRFFVVDPNGAILNILSHL